MGIKDWLKGLLGVQRSSAVEPRPNTSSRSPVTVSLEIGGNPCVEVAGTTTFAKTAVLALASRYRLPERGYLEAGAWLQREPDNPVDADAVVIVVDGEKVGNLPSHLARALPLPPGISKEVIYQLHVVGGKKWAAKAFVWLGPGRPQWTYTADTPPPLTSRDRTLTRARQQSDMVREALESGGERAAQFQRGMYQGFITYSWSNRSNSSRGRAVSRKHSRSAIRQSGVLSRIEMAVNQPPGIRSRQQSCTASSGSTKKRSQCSSDG